MKLDFYCVMCGREKSLSVNAEDGKIDAKKVIESAGWITQQNGPNFDIYCCKKCAA